jgi:hypothetical protein
MAKLYLEEAMTINANSRDLLNNLVRNPAQHRSLRQHCR